MPAKHIAALVAQRGEARQALNVVPPQHKRLGAKGESKSNSPKKRASWDYTKRVQKPRREWSSNFTEGKLINMEVNDSGAVNKNIGRT